MSKNLTTEGFIEKGKKVHGDKYDYSSVEYVRNDIKVNIICSNHGIFKQVPAKHLLGQGCPKCGKEKASNNKLFTTEEFIEKAKLIHGNKYDYSLTEYVRNNLNVKIICLKHGAFEQKPNKHLSGHGCPKCVNKNITTEEFIEKANLIHNTKYDYSQVKYVNSRKKIKIICLKHGEFTQTVDRHLSGCGCRKCGFLIQKSTTEEFIEKAKKIHSNKYDYSLVDYVQNKKKIKIICKKHGIFNQKPNSHLNGSGCPTCNESKGEKIIARYLDNYNVNYIRQYKFNNCKNKRCLPFDFYLPNNNICVEFDGGQHNKIINYFGGENGFKLRRINDEIKNNFTKDNKIKLIRIKYNQIKNIENILNEELKIQ
jgi:very-short-patch-repair endonuclease